MLSAVFDDGEIASILRLMGKEELIPTFVWDGDDGTQVGIASLAERGFLVPDSRGALALRPDFATFLESLVHPDIVLDILSMEDFQPRRMSIIVKEDSAYTLAVLRESFAVKELPDPRSVMEVVLDHLGKPSQGPVQETLSFCAGELLMLMMLLGMKDLYKGDLPGLAEFSAKTVWKEIRKGKHIPLVAGLLLFGANDSLGGYFSNEEEVGDTLDVLVKKGALERTKRGYRISKDFLPFVLAMGSPDRITIISMVRDPDSEDPYVDALTFFEFGGVMVVMSVIDPEEAEVDLMIIPDSDSLLYLLTEFLFVERNLSVEREEITAIAKELLAKGEISLGKYNAALSYFHANDQLGDVDPLDKELTATVTICPNCGHPNTSNAKFCVNCGSPLMTVE